MLTLSRDSVFDSCADFRLFMNGKLAINFKRIHGQTPGPSVSLSAHCYTTNKST
jgi:hypothetical protein